MTAEPASSHNDSQSPRLIARDGATSSVSNASNSRMQLKEAQQLLSNLTHRSPSLSDGLRELKAATQRAHEYAQNQHSVMAQLYLEHCFSLLMQCFHYMNIQADQVVTREYQRDQGQLTDQSERVILMFSDHAELRVNGELKGTFPLYSEQDYTQLQEIAQLFQCRVDHADHIQLTLFERLNKASSS